MSHLFLRATLVSLALLAATGAAHAQHLVNSHDLFYNYYVGPAANAGGTTAQMYISPRPVPAFVGHTYNTYQPLMPHEYLWQHKRTYSSSHPNGGWTRTNISYGHSVGPGWFRPWIRPNIPHPVPNNYDPGWAW